MFQLSGCDTSSRSASLHACKQGVVGISADFAAAVRCMFIHAQSETQLRYVCMDMH